jgi:hypothetical protein
MLQILGWLVCLCLFVKGIELLELAETGKQERQLRAGAVIAMLGAVGFAVWIYFQGAALSDAGGRSGPALYQPDPHADDCLDKNGNYVSCDSKEAL